MNRLQCLGNIPWVNEEKSYSLADLLEVTTEAGEATALLVPLVAAPLITEGDPLEYILKQDSDMHQPINASWARLGANMGMTNLREVNQARSLNKTH